jgi:hypothetical protein
MSVPGTSTVLPSWSALNWACPQRAPMSNRSCTECTSCTSWLPAVTLEPVDLGCGPVERVVGDPRVVEQITCDHDRVDRFVTGEVDRGDERELRTPRGVGIEPTGAEMDVRRVQQRRGATAVGRPLHASQATSAPHGHVPDCADAAGEAPLEAPLLRGRDFGVVHGLFRVCDRLSPRRVGLPGRREDRPTGSAAAHPARGHARGSGPGNRRSTSSCSAGPERSTRSPGSTRTSCSHVRPTRSSPRSARTANSCPRSSCTSWSTT